MAGSRGCPVWRAGWTRSRDLKAPAREDFPGAVGRSAARQSEAGMSDARTAILDRLRAGAAHRHVSRRRQPPVPRRIVRRPTGAARPASSRSSPRWASSTFVESSAAAVRARVASIVGTRRCCSWDAGSAAVRRRRDARRASTGASARDEQARRGRRRHRLRRRDRRDRIAGAAVGRGQAARRVAAAADCTSRSCGAAICAVAWANSSRRSPTRLRGARAARSSPGPSRTADIELTLTLGVHGPGEVIVVVGP